MGRMLPLEPTLIGNRLRRIVCGSEETNPLNFFLKKWRFVGAPMFIGCGRLVFHFLKVLIGTRTSKWPPRSCDATLHRKISREHSRRTRLIGELRL